MIRILIVLYASGVGRWDGATRAGRIVEGRPTFPLVLGTDGAGVVVAVGAWIRRLKVGDEVYSYGWSNPKGGFYAEYVAVEADKVACIPKRLDLTNAGAIAAIALTALQGIDSALQLRRGETIIVHGASGGVCMLAVQFAKLRGALVLATASGRDRLRRMAWMRCSRSLAALSLIDASTPQSVEAAWPTRAGSSFRPPRRGIAVTRYDAIAGVREFERLNRAVEDTRLKVPSAKEFPLRQAASAHERLAKGHAVGLLRIENR